MKTLLGKVSVRIYPERRDNRSWGFEVLLPLREAGETMAISVIYESGQLRLHLGALGVIQSHQAEARAVHCWSDAIEPFDCIRTDAVDWLCDQIDLLLAPDFSDIEALGE